MKKFSLVLTLGLILCLSVTGCSKKSTEESVADSEISAFTPRLDAEQTVTLNIVGPLQNFEALEAAINDFGEYYPNCEVLYTYLSQEYIETRLASDNSVGIFMVTPTRYLRYDFYSDYCVNLLEEDIDLSAIKSSAVEGITINGKTFGVPIAEDTYGLLVNVSLLEEEGLSIPENYQDFLTDCEVLKKDGYTPIQGFERFTPDGEERDDCVIYMNLIRNMFTVFLSVKERSGDSLDALYSGQEGSAEFLLPVFETLEEIIKNGYTDPAVNQTYEDNYNDSILRFFEGDVPFMSGSAETFSGTKKRETKSEHYSSDPFEYCFISTPLAADDVYSAIDVWQCFCANEQCPDKEWALEFLRFVATEDELNQFASIKGLPSVAVNGNNDRYVDIYSGKEEYTANSFTIPSTVEDALSAATLGLAYGEIDAEGAVELMESLLRE